ncbi:universal stress protein [Desulfofustis glycolicus]|uniref:Universal stress protein n=1 Tax=Desulfofustis glycolicus DSM 9705 TaxID=1121409 RepID=A0A1M5T8A6_9BACT|nr:universal stress protein [Desulfofustis glycolicus]MCB2215414.1 universal stress protein [Desulfobulbaceae bacterium]SHH46952.1 Nucleotide-binding universal stress protein, UspA family [Desulfofustis glycolicus DSM 9705]
MQMTHILLPVDGSIHSKDATDYAVYLAKLSGARVTAVCCYEWCSNLYEVTQSAIDELKDKLRKNAEQIIDETKEKLAAAGIDYEAETVSGAPGVVLTKMIKSKEFDLVVMGSHGHSDIGGLFLGSITHKVLNKIYCPVLIVP